MAGTLASSPAGSTILGRITRAGSDGPGMGEGFRPSRTFPMFGGSTKLAEEGDERGVRRMLDAGTPVDVIDHGRFNVTPLQAAARSGHLEVVKLLLARGANVNHVDHDGFS